MTFLNPFVLFGLAAASIPILIHLFNIRKLRTIEFSTLTFLKELNKNKIRKIKIRQWLLLALRTLLILLIVLAFSRPALKGTFGMTGTRASSTIVILFDNSPSMSLGNERGKFLAQAQSRALQIVSLLQPDDEVYFLRLNDLPKQTTEQPVRDRTIVERLINETEIGYSYRTIEDGLRVTAGILQHSKNFNKEIYVLTDGQSVSFAAAGSKTSTEQLFAPNVKLFFSQFSTKAAENVSVENVSVPPSLLHVGKPFTVNAVIRNHGASAVVNHLATISFDGQRVMQKSISLSGGETGTIEFTITPKRSGPIFGTLELENDQFEPDDRFLFTVNIPAKIDVAVIASDERYSRFVLAAMNAAAAVNPLSPVNATTLAPSRISSAALSQNDVAVMTGVNTLSSSQQDALLQFVRNGGSLLFFPSADTTSASYNYLSPMGLTDFFVSHSPATFDKLDLQYPLFNGMFDQNQSKTKINIESPTVSTSLHLRSETALRSIITLSNGRSFLWMMKFGRGKILGSAVPAVNEWSDFPVKGIFVPLIYQSILYLSSPVNTESEHPLFVGERIEFSSAQMDRRRALSSSAVHVHDPAGRTIPLQSFNKTTGDGISETTFLFEDQRAPGIYSVAVENDTLLQLPVNVRREESDVSLIAKNTVADHVVAMGIEGSSFIDVSPESDVAAIVSQSRFGIELWKYFLLAALFVGLIEMFVAREPKQQ
ncbi:MAG: BatA domain-containing protein [Bacteroidota bacterium]